MCRNERCFLSCLSIIPDIFSLLILTCLRRSADSGSLTTRKPPPVIYSDVCACSSDISIKYCTPRGDELDTRLLRAMVIKGVLEEITTANVNMVNADLLSDARGLRISETTVRTEGTSVLSGMSVAISASSSKFSGAISKGGAITVEVRLFVLCRFLPSFLSAGAQFSGAIAVVRLFILCCFLSIC